jgi:hypothetical protein
MQLIRYSPKHCSIPFEHRRFSYPAVLTGWIRFVCKESRGIKSLAEGEQLGSNLHNRPTSPNEINRSRLSDIRFAGTIEPP